MQLSNTLLCIVKCILLCNIAVSSAKSWRKASNKCHTDVKTIYTAQTKNPARGAKYVIGAKTKTSGSGLVADDIQMALKPTEEFQYMQIRMNFGAHEYDSPYITADDLKIKKDKKWHQVYIDLEPTDLYGIDNWHLYIKSDHKTVDIDTGYVWHYAPYKPRLFTVFAKGLSYWIHNGNASVCNALDAQLHSRGHYSQISGGRNSALSALSTEKNLVILLLPLLLLMRIVAAQAVD